jgi:hypothetical protein
LADGQAEMNMRRSFIIVDLLESGKAKVEPKKSLSYLSTGEGSDAGRFKVAHILTRNEREL